MNDKCSNGFCKFDSYTTTKKYKIMQVKCKICKKDLTSQAIKLLEGKIKEIKCKCKNIKLWK